MERTHAWAERAKAAHQRQDQALFGIVQGGTDVATATVTSFVGTAFGVLAMLLCIPLLTRLATQFQSSEYFLLALFGVLICGSLTAPDIPLKGWLAGLFGLFLADLAQAGLIRTASELEPTALQALTQGEGSFTAEYHDYELVPSNVQQEIMAEFQPEAEED